ncbi:hypothetical protein I546_5205 [Mycobacterium kansasii 732]|nr:hypothetical protein I546_5205 [Mycobacterium kansasii 732]
MEHRVWPWQRSGSTQTFTTSSFPFLPVPSRSFPFLPVPSRSFPFLPVPSRSFPFLPVPSRSFPAQVFRPPLTPRIWPVM